MDNLGPLLLHMALNCFLIIVIPPTDPTIINFNPNQLPMVLTIVDPTIIVINPNQLPMDLAIIDPIIIVTDPTITITMSYQTTIKRSPTVSQTKVSLYCF